MPVLTAIDVIGIQSYVFASNRLRDVVGASRLVDWATSRANGEGLDVSEAPKPHVILAAGGNAVLRFAAENDAKEFVLRYTRRLLDEAPGLDVAIAHHEIQEGEMARGLLALQVKLAKAKFERRPHAPQLGLGVMQPCAVTGLPASDFSEDFGGQWVSRRIATLRKKANTPAAIRRWDEVTADLATDCDHLQGRRLRFPNELDQMGRTRGDTSIVGIVHVDGNGTGKRIQDWLVANQSVADDALCEEIHKWSGALDGLLQAVFRSVLNRLTARVSRKEHDGDVFQVQGQPCPPRQLDFDLITDDDGVILLPIRPILLGGDDLTFVCDGRIALDLAARALKAFGEESRRAPDLVALGTEPFTACAGVALVRAHAPFSRGYDLCEALCASSKRAKADAESTGASVDTGCWLDWHIGAVRPDESLEEIRERQYGSKLTCRPYPLGGPTATRVTWKWLDTELLGESTGDDACLSFRNPRVWGERRNKVKTLASLVREGEQAIASQLEAWRRLEKTIALPKPLENGFKGERTPLLDAVELLDIHLRLEPPVDPTTAASEIAVEEAEAP